MTFNVKTVVETPDEPQKIIHAGWIRSYPQLEPNPMFQYGICSNCGGEQSIVYDLPYCPWCGAVMDLDVTLTDEEAEKYRALIEDGWMKDIEEVDLFPELSPLEKRFNKFLAHLIHLFKKGETEK